MKKTLKVLRTHIGIWVLSTFILAWGSEVWPKSRIIFENDRIQAAVLEGSWYQIGKDAAQFSHIDQGHFFPNEVKANFDSLMLQYFKFSFLTDSLKSLLLPRLVHHVFTEESDLIQGSADGFGISADDLTESFVIPELQNYMALDYTKFLKFMGGPHFACTSFIVKDKGGSRIFGRNLDFAGVGYLDKNISVYLIRPMSGYKILTVSTRGLPTPGITGMNEKGLALALHVVYSNYVDQRHGVPVLSVNREVLQNASTVAEAIEIYQKYKYESGWMVHLTGKDRSVIVELDGRGANVFEYDDGISLLNNEYASEGGKKVQLRFSAGTEIYNFDRFSRLKSLLAAQTITSLDQATAILNDSFSPYNGGSVADFSTSAIRSIDQVSTMVLKPDELSLWISNGAAPSSFGDFYKFGMETFEDGKPIPVHSSILKQNPAAQEYSLAQASMSQAIDMKGAYIHLLRAKRMANDCSFDLSLGNFALVLGHYEMADKALQSARNCPILNTHETAIASYLHGLLFAIKQNKTMSLKALQEAIVLEEALPLTLKIKSDLSLLAIIKNLRRDVNAERFPTSSGDVTIDLKYGDRTLGW
jgi:hypothetical protein